MDLKNVLDSKEKIYSIDLFITEECNLKCKYCFHRKGKEVSGAPNQTFTVEDGRRVLDRVYKLNPDSMTVNFFGGEPLLYPDMLLDLMRYTKELWKDKGKLVISTNGTVFNKELFAELKSMDVGIQVSFDGDEDTQNSNRGEFDLVASNIKNMLEFGAVITVRMTFTPDNVGSLSKNVQFIHDLGVEKIVHHAVMEADWTEEAIREYNVQLLNLLHYRRYCQNKKMPLTIGFIDKCLLILNDELPIEKDFCAAGKSFIAILPNGDVYPCHRAASKRIFKLGNIFNEDRPFIRGIFLDIDKISQGCQKNCRAAKICHTCIMVQFEVMGDLQKPLLQNHYCDIPCLEYDLCKQYLPTEISDKQGRMLTSLAQVVSDIMERLDDAEK